MTDDGKHPDRNRGAEHLRWIRRLRPEVEVDLGVLERTRSILMATATNRPPPVQNPPPGTPTIIPHLPYQDGAAAVDWLERVFGFREIEAARIEHPGGLHAEMEIGAGRIMIGSPGGHGAFPPKGSGTPSQLLSVYVDDIDNHYQHAIDSGATICTQIEDKFYGDRVYEALDLEGHRWSFHMHTGRRFPFDGG
jgi:uncharacterized glyoxalase superfamily protein PhnB